jgi:hypothetical protein
LIEIIRSRATLEQIEHMLEVYKFYIKVAVDVKYRVLAGGGEMHYDSEQALLEDGSQQIIFGLLASDPTIREEVAKIIIEFLG